MSLSQKTMDLLDAHNATHGKMAAAAPAALDPELIQSAQDDLAAAGPVGSPGWLSVLFALLQALPQLWTILSPIIGPLIKPPAPTPTPGGTTPTIGPA